MLVSMTGIDVINVQETPLHIHSAPGDYSDARLIQNSALARVREIISHLFSVFI